VYFRSPFRRRIPREGVVIDDLQRDDQANPAAVDPNLVSYDDAVLGDTELGRLSSKALRAFTKASRACLLYDFDNDSVGSFLRELDIRLEKILVHGPLELEVRPSTLLRDGEAVYREQDREKSLAFRLYRDGVRSIRIQPSVSWDEIVRLVGILSIRYTGIRQQEDDIVTMLWGADFDHIELEAVDRYTPNDDELDAGSSRRSSRERISPEFWEVCERFDRPSPELAEPADLSFCEPAEEELEALRQLDGGGALPSLCQRLVELLMLTITVPVDPMDARLAAPILCEMRDHMIAEGLDEALLDLIRTVHENLPRIASPEGRSALMGVLVDRRALAKMMDTAIERDCLPPTLIEVIRMTPPGELEVLLGVLANRWTGPGRDTGRKILSAALGEHPETLELMVRETTGILSADLLALFAEHAPEGAVDLALACTRREDRPLRHRALELLRRLPYRSEVGRELTAQILESDDPEDRRLAAIVLAAKGETRAYSKLLRLLREGVAADADAKAIETYSVAIARLSEDRAFSTFQEWIRPDGKRLKAKATPTKLWRPAIWGLSAIPGSEAAELLAWIHSKCDGALQSIAAKAIATHRERFGHE
jgi:hypothetical protein